MHKVCVIGDSHAAMLRKSWSGLEIEFPEVVLTFFAAMEPYYAGLTLDGTLLRATTKELAEKFELTSNGSHSIDARYDLYLICGLGFAPQHAFAARKEYWACHSGVIPPGAFETELPDAIADELRKSASMRTLKMLRAITKAPIGMIAVPRPHSFEEEAAAPAKANRRRSRLLSGAFETACHRVAEEGGAVFLPQPAETLTKGNAMFSRSVFAARSKEDPDRGHKNAGYGAIILRDALNSMTPKIVPFRDGVR